MTVFDATSICLSINPESSISHSVQSLNAITVLPLDRVLPIFDPVEHTPTALQPLRCLCEDIRKLVDILLINYYADPNAISPFCHMKWQAVPLLKITRINCFSTKILLLTRSVVMLSVSR